LFELQEWLGHSSPESTRHYTRITPTKLAKSYQDAGYFARNLRAVEVLIDQDVVRRGSPPDEPWKLYDLGHRPCGAGTGQRSRKNNSRDPPIAWKVTVGVAPESEAGVLTYEVYSRPK
jgi:hypothetical protein